MCGLRAEGDHPQRYNEDGVERRGDHYQQRAKNYASEQASESRGLDSLHVGQHG